jgi:hypothetical protein
MRARTTPRIVFPFRRCYRRRRYESGTSRKYVCEVARRTGCSSRGQSGQQIQFREQAELIDGLFSYRFDEYDKKLDLKLAALEDRLDAKLEMKLEAKLESKLKPIRADLTFVKDSVRVILDRLNEGPRRG